MIRRSLSIAAVVGLVAAPAHAQTVDPGSPTGKEYAIPLTSARQDAAAGRPSSPSSEAKADTGAPLFGEGVGDGSASGTPPRRKGTPKSQPASRTDASPASSGKPTQAAVASVHRAAVTVPAGRSGSLLTIAAVALSVLLLGGVLGSIARRRGA